MKNLRWYQHVLFWIGILGVFITPVLFTRPYLKDWSIFDFSQTGSIGDTIGGITAPIVGLISIILLWWTLQARLKFNQDQERINKAQRKFNDASRVLSMQTQIMQLDENIRFGYSTKDYTHEGRGSSSLCNLQKGTPANVKIPYDVLLSVIDKAYMLDVSVTSLVNVAKESDLSDEERKATMSIALVYIENLLHFYEMASTHEIEYLLPMSEVGNELIGLPKAQETIRSRTDMYADKLRLIEETCNSFIR